MKIRNILFAAALVFFASCRSSHSGGYGITAHQVTTISTSINDYDLEVSPDGITYTIDISTPEGRLKLKNQSLKDAQDLVLQEAAMANNAALIVNPKFTHYMEGKQILRITVFGFPARYKAKD